jgi:selenocysteine lyase/cysteine desulfurase
MINSTMKQTAQSNTPDLLLLLKKALRASLEHYSNVHRGSGQNSLIATHLYEKARKIVLHVAGFSDRKYEVIFCTPHRAHSFTVGLNGSVFELITSKDLGLPLGITAVVVKKTALPKHSPYQTGGGTVKIVSEDHVLWADAPDRFEAGTPAIINVILFALAFSISKGHPLVGPFLSQKRSIPLRTFFNTPGYNTLTGKELLARIKTSILGKQLLVPTEEGDRPYTNLDNGASTPTFESICTVAERVLTAPYRMYPAIISFARKTLLSFLGAPASTYELVFVSNTTEAINAAASNLAAALGKKNEPVIVNSLMEHNSNELPWRTIPHTSQIRLGVDGEGFIDLRELEKVLREYNHEKAHGRKRIVLVAVSGASNVLGSFNDLSAISRLAHRYQAAFLVDAAQLIAHRKVNMHKAGIDYLAFSGHKAYAPFGSGGLILRKDRIALPKEQWAKLNASGEENILGIATLVKMVQIFQRIGMDVIAEDEHELAVKLLNGICSFPQFKVYGVCSGSSSHIRQKGAVVTISCSTIPFNLLANRLAERGGIGVRSGCFCAHLLGKRLLGIQGLKEKLYDLGFRFAPHFTKDLIPGLVRISAGLENTPADIEYLLRMLGMILAEPRTMLEKRLAASHNGTPFLPRYPIDAVIDSFISRIVEKVYSIQGADGLEND